MKGKQFARLRLGPPRRITAGLTDHEHPAVAPDGRHIAYYCGEYGSIGIAVCSLDGRLARVISPPGGNSTQPAWRPDSAALAYRHQDTPKSKWELWETALLGEGAALAPRRLHGHRRWHYKHPYYSLDGTRMAYFSDEGSKVGAYHLWLWDLNSSAHKQVTFGNTQMHSHPVFSPDGTRLLYHAYEGTDENKLPGITNLFELDLESNEVRQLTSAQDQYKHPFYIDDNVIVFHHERNSDGVRGLAAMHLSTLTIIKLTDGSNNDKHPFPFRRDGMLWLAWASKHRGSEVEAELNTYDIFIAPLRSDKPREKQKGQRKKA